MDLDRELTALFKEDISLPEPVQAGLERSYDKLRHRGNAKAPRRSGKTVRVLLLAAVLASLFSITAFAAYLSRMNVQLNQGERQIYRWDDHDTASNPLLVLHFDVPEEGNLYYFQPGWLPLPPDGTGNLDSSGIYSAWSNLKGRASRTAFEEGLDEDAVLERLAADAGLSQEELEQWYWLCENVPGGSGDIPYQIRIYSPADLYGLSFLVGQTGGAVEIPSEETDEQWTCLTATADYSSLSNMGMDRVNYVFRFQQEEGYLLSVTGTEDPETLNKIADGLKVLKTGATAAFSGDLNQQNYTILEPGRG